MLFMFLSVMNEMSKRQTPIGFFNFIQSATQRRVPFLQAFTSHIRPSRPISVSPSLYRFACWAGALRICFFLDSTSSNDFARLLATSFFTLTAIAFVFFGLAIGLISESESLAELLSDSGSDMTFRGDLGILLFLTLSFFIQR